ncbi:unnamed protein product, partial [Notodromas monacha]
SSGSGSGPDSLEDELQTVIKCNADEGKGNFKLHRSASEKVNKKMSSSLPAKSDQLLPPQNFCVTRIVGEDGILLAWEPPHDVRVSGYKIFVDGEFNSKVRSPQRTKALISGVHRLRESGARVVIDIRSVNVDGAMSVPAATDVKVPPPPPCPSSRQQHDVATESCC